MQVWQPMIDRCNELTAQLAAFSQRCREVGNSIEALQRDIDSTLAQLQAPTAGFCEHCGSGPTCSVCGRGLPLAEAEAELLRGL